MLLPQGRHLLLGLGQLPQALPFEFPLLVGFLQGTDPFLVIFLGRGSQGRLGRLVLSSLGPSACLGCPSPALSGSPCGRGGAKEKDFKGPLKLVFGYLLVVIEAKRFLWVKVGLRGQQFSSKSRGDLGRSRQETILLLWALDFRVDRRIQDKQGLRKNHVLEKTQP